MIALKDDGAVAKFEMNDRCAAGTGRFLEVMATALSYSMPDFVQAGREATTARTINAMCTVFAESEVISATAQGVDRAELSRGLHEAVVRPGGGHAAPLAPGRRHRLLRWRGPQRLSTRDGGPRPGA